MLYYTKVKLSTKLNVVISVSIAFVLMVFGWFYILYEEGKILDIFKKNIVTLGLNLAHNSEFGLLSLNKKELILFIEGIFKEDSVVASAILDDKNKVVVLKTDEAVFSSDFFKKNVKKYSRKQNNKSMQIKRVVIKNSLFFIMTAPVFTASVPKDSLDGFWPDLQYRYQNDEYLGHIILCVALETMLKELNAGRIIYFCSIFLLLLVISLLIMFFNKKMLINPINKLVQGTKKIGSGNFDFKFDFKREDEIGFLAGSFNEMAENLKINHQNLLKEKNFSEQLIDSQKDMLFVLDRKGYIIKCNVIGIVASGYKKEDLYAKPCVMIFHNLADARQKIYNELLSGKAVYNWETEAVSQSGKFFSISVNGAPLINDKGMVIGAICAGRDITERLRMESELKEYAQNLEEMVERRTKELKLVEAQLIHSSKLVSLGEMAAGVAHEINQPLNVIRITTTGILHFLRKGKIVSKEMFEGELNNIDGQINRITKIIDHMRLFTTKSKIEYIQEVEINKPLQDSLSFVSQQLRINQVKVTLELGKALPVVLADANKLEQVFLNIITNAKDAMETIRDNEKKLYIRSFTKNNYVIVTIKDTGGGILKENRDKVFEPFFTSKDPGRGTGLGMSISYGIINEFSGKLTFETEENVGTVFKIELPVCSKSKS